jgi:hypothetical protein
MPEHTITTDCVWRNWLGGTVDSLPFAVKICDINSPDGIDNGRVLKLFLYTEDGEQELAAYERGWSIYPTGKQEASMDALIAYCATLPPADNWHFRAGGENPTLC